MRIVQLIDTLEVGGAEKMAVNFSNALEKRIAFSGLVASRREGILINSVENKDNYLFLGKKSTFDFNAVFVLKAYCKKHKIDFIQAHGTSFFLAFLVKLFYPRVGVLFHDHSGARSDQKISSNFILWMASFFFSGIITVNEALQKWARQKLNCGKIICLHNFTAIDCRAKSTVLKGVDGKRILCLANLRHPKNHFLLIEIAAKLRQSHPEWTFHLIGKDNKDDYSQALRAAISHQGLDQNVFLYGQQSDTGHIIGQSDICILTSSSEGLPVVILEYGLMEKPVVATAVGEIPLLVEHGKSGFTVGPDDAAVFCDSLAELIENPTLRIKFGKELHAVVSANNSEMAVIDRFLNWLGKSK